MMPVSVRRSSQVSPRRTAPIAAANAFILILNSFAACVVFANGVDAAVIVGLVIDPATTAGSGSSSTRSGPGTWQVYAVDTGANSLGISSFDIRLKVATGTMAINNRLPQTNYDSDGVGTPVQAGFNTVRQTLGNNTASVEFTGAQGPPPSANSSANVGIDFFPVGGFGQTASGFAAKYPNAILGPTTGSSWGNYAPVSHISGRNWMLVGEGTYTDSTSKPVITFVGATVYFNFSTNFNSIPPVGGTVVLPEPSSIAHIGMLIALASIGFGTRNSG